LKKYSHMASVGIPACRKVRLAASLHPVKPRKAAAPKTPKFPGSLKLLEENTNFAGRPINAKVVGREGKVIFVSFSAENPKPGHTIARKEKPVPSQQKEKSPSTYFQTAPSSKQMEIPGNVTKPRTRIRGAMRSSSSQKGLQNLKRGKFDQGWMIKWLDWYKFVIAMTRKPWDASSPAHPKSMSAEVRAESAKTAWAS
jgi:hypothetical protein